jgi:hypothetical protein
MELYKKKLLSGLVRSYKAKKLIIGPRIPLSSGKGRTIIQKCEGRCQVSGEEYGKLTHGFIIHHIDGNRTNNADKNLVLMAATYHNAIHGEVNVIFHEYKKNHPIIAKPKPIPKPKSSGKSEYGDVNVLERWKRAELESQEKWKIAVNQLLKNLGYNF